MVPATLTTHLVNWYHTYLLHPGINRTEATTQQHFYWPDMRQDIRTILKKCSIYQIYKKTTKKYGRLLEKQAEAEPWERLCVDLIEPYTIN